MSQKRVFPLNNPLSEKSQSVRRTSCPYCSWTGKTTEQLRVHLEKYHENRLAEEGEKSVREGGDIVARNSRWLLAHGYVKCPWLTVPCPTKINLLMARVCKHLNDCPS